MSFNVIRGFQSRRRQLSEWSALSDAARRQTGKSAAVQMREILALRKSGGQCGMSDYYCYKLYDDAYRRGRGNADFLGWRLEQAFSMALNPRYAVLPAWDKLVFTTLASAAGLPVAPLRAYFHVSKVLAGELGEHLASPAAVAAFLRDPANFPLFAKPAYSQQGFGSAYLASYDAGQDALVFLDGKTVPVGEFVQRMQVSVDVRYHRPECGFVFQQPLALAPQIAALTAWSAICGVRIICLNGDDGVKPLTALWKVALPPNYVDNFSKGKYGNLLAAVDIGSGRVTRPLNAFWPHAQVHETHPLTHCQLEGFQIPCWDQLLAACRLGGATFPLMRIHHWDFAITDRGPVMLELNDLGMTIGPQIHGKGLLTEETREFLRRYADPASHAWTAAL